MPEMFPIELFIYAVTLEELTSGKRVTELLPSMTAIDSIREAKSRQMKPEENSEQWVVKSLIQIEGKKFEALVIAETDEEQS